MEQINDTLSIKIEDIQINETVQHSIKVEDTEINKTTMNPIDEFQVNDQRLNMLVRTPEAYNARISKLSNAPTWVKNSGGRYKKSHDKMISLSKKINLAQIQKWQEEYQEETRNLQRMNDLVGFHEGLAQQQQQQAQQQQLLPHQQQQLRQQQQQQQLLQQQQQQLQPFKHCF